MILILVVIAVIFNPVDDQAVDDSGIGVCVRYSFFVKLDPTTTQVQLSAADPMWCHSNSVKTYKKPHLIENNLLCDSW